MSFNYQAIKSEILEYILKDKNTSLLSKRMGFTFDKVARWKNGSKQLKWDEFCELCHHLKLPLKDALEYIGFKVTKNNNELKFFKFLRGFHPELSTKELAEKLAIGPSTLLRYVNQEAYPEIELIFELIDMRDEILDHFLGFFTHIETRKLDLHYIKYPWMPAVANAASLEKYTSLPEHSPEWIANFLNIPVYQVNMAFEEFVKMGIIEKNGPHYTKTPQAPNKRTFTISFQDNEKLHREMIKYLTKKAVPPYENTMPNSSAARCYYRVFSCGPENNSRISEILAKAEQEIHDLLTKNPEPADDVRVVVLHNYSATHRP